jgi:hypothetical protein
MNDLLGFLNLTLIRRKTNFYHQTIGLRKIPLLKKGKGYDISYISHE